ncbi:MAG TPA: amidohydrolase family protein [Blastocatellia bacterium]|nr:amidohydrolase family protein [Blastocatellia bacterium]
MKMQIRSHFRLTLFLALVSALTALPLARRAETRTIEGEAWAIKGGTVVTVTGATIPKGVVVIRNGLIEAVGADVPVPADARVIDATGLTVYPGLIDANTNLGLAAPTPAASAGGRGGAPAVPALALTTAAAPAAPPAGLSPELMAADQLKVTPETFDAQRAAGITTALSAPREGIYQGQSVLINLGSDAPEKLILKSPVTLNVAFSPTRGGGYPASLMGVFAFLRQSLLDAQWYREVWTRYNKEKRGLQRPEVDKSLAALQPVINGEMPVMLTANTVREIKRAIGLAEEFKLRYFISGGLQSYQIADLLKEKNATVLLSLNYPQRPANLEDPESEALRVLRDRAEAPKAAATLHKAGVRFAFQSGYLSRPSDFIANAAKAVEAGLPKDAALRALTIWPAEIFGVSEQLGSIEKGKIANLIVTSGDLFDRRTQVKYVFIDGRQYEVKAPAPNGPAGRGGGRPGAAAAASAAGEWAITAQSPNGPVQVTLSVSQEGSAINGSITTPFGTFPVSGRVSGSEVTFSFTAKVQDQEMPVTAKGTIDGNSIKGTMSVMGQEAEFSGTRTPKQ